MKKYVIGTILFVLWTLGCVYGTYNNTVSHAHVLGATTSYEIQYDNTGDIFTYDVDNHNEDN